MSGEANGQVAAWLAGSAERTVTTGCAYVFLKGDAAYKLKRPVRLGYVDLSTPERRLWALGRELEFNRATAPDIYRAVRRVTRAGAGFALDGDGETVEHVLEMRRFDDQALLATRPERLDGALCEQLGRAIASAHAAAPLRQEADGGALNFTLASNASLLRGMVPRLDASAVEEVVRRSDEAMDRLRLRLAGRAAAGYVRRCHGDLHLGNILVEGGRPVLFDCIEFSDRLSDIDVQYDLAFLIMDLAFRGRREAAAHVLSAYLDEAARHFPSDLWAGTLALPLMMSARAAVRAHVAGNSGDDRLARRYLDAALSHLSPEPPMLLAVGGLSGVGKSVFARKAAPFVGPSPGAVVLRTDEVRKRLAGVAPRARGSAELYAEGAVARTYEEMLGNARALLRAGRGVVLDATFLDATWRERAAQLARDGDVAFSGVWLEAPQAALAQRIADRRGDASDATPQVLRSQTLRDPGVIDWVRLDASGSIDATLAAWAGPRQEQARASSNQLTPKGFC